MNGLIGCPDLVGGDLAEQRCCGAQYNSKNFPEITGRHFDRRGRTAAAMPEIGLKWRLIR